MSKFSKLTIVQAPSGVNVPKYFNEHFTDGKWCAFITPDTVYDKDELEHTIVNLIEDYPEIACLYSDNICTPINYKTYYPTYRYNICANITINTPLICNTNLPLRFNENLRYLYYYDLLKRVCSSHMTWHIPKHLFTIPGIKNTKDVMQELEFIQNG